MKLELTYHFEDEDELRAHLSSETRAAPAPTTATAAPAPTEDDDAPTRSDTDSDGMPWDEAVHSDPPSFKSDGTWRAKRGKADEEKAARAAFKAQGGDMAPPADLPTEPAPEPAAAGLPGMAALPTDAPAPVSWDRMIEAVTEAMQSGRIDNSRMTELYKKHGGDDPVQFLATNETARAALVADLTA